VYVSLSNNTVNEYSINSDGTLNLIGTTTTGNNPDWVATGN
jgi:hypothetical protein